MYSKMIPAIIWNGSQATWGNYSAMKIKDLESTEQKLIMSPHLYYLLVAVDNFRVF